ncbi:uncharacterized protein STEHIDRAFT_75157 [Stereum hirsutum FP-91666 SS1]|uniref:uncharacterized protein n=1 Tax=Stereum hirsutum (strain FP-91666) TaxID=721885 RepID=UPI000440E157|nr:uncharacterized protein STEHIDRAFT_75157 [Stereum hirsutum FP-91666 SS1]EIM90401.1 hypothetical protein STEHIDRAFT_75157 [Stereum hirsutum FP-91666 SS1]
MQAPDLFASTRSHIPIPASSVKKQPSGMRMSMAGPALRGAPFPTPNMAPPGTNPRQSSMYRSQNMNPLLASASKPNYGRTPMNSSTRRGSMWGGAPMPPPPLPVKDSRPLRDRQFQVKMRQDIVTELQNSGYDIHPSTLANITGKDFRAIFHHLVLLLDPNYPFNHSARFEDEFLPAMRALRYPFVGQLDSKWLAAPASMHSWPSLLGVLHWLVNLVEQRFQYANSDEPTLQLLDTVPEEFDDENHHRALAFEHCVNTYERFLANSDDFTQEEQELEQRYAKKNERTLLGLEEERKQFDQLRTELEKLHSSEAPIVQVEAKNQTIKSDLAKFEKLLQYFTDRRTGYLKTISDEKADLAIRTKYLDDLRAEQNRLSDVVREQNLSPEEVHRMTTEHEQLTRSLEDLKYRIAESHNNIMTLEVQVENRSAAAEEALDAYTSLISSLGLFPPLPSPFQNVDLTLELNTAASHPSHILTGSDIQRVIKPTLSEISQSRRGEKDNVETERIQLDNELEILVSECENLEEEINELDKKVGALNEQADDLREAAQQEALVSNAEATRLERDLAQARTAALANGVGVKSRLQSLQIAYREQIEKVTRLREETVRAIIKNCSDIVMFKESVSQHLKHLQEYAEAN